MPRRAFVTMYDGAAKLVYEAVVDLGARVIDSWKSMPGRFPSYLVEHMTGVEENGRGSMLAGRRRCVSAASPTSTSR